MIVIHESEEHLYNRHPSEIPPSLIYLGAA